MATKKSKNGSGTGRRSRGNTHCSKCQRKTLTKRNGRCESCGAVKSR